MPDDESASSVISMPFSTTSEISNTSQWASRRRRLLKPKQTVRGPVLGFFPLSSGHWKALRL
ncbi:hypothetical protein P692DRAFT_20825002 [Suillus brevipes Sb2]|nr:hypothetical protein P692DRAFT_20825002 [Suillus brevipes Sb2]